MCSVSTTVAYSLCLVPWEAWQWQISHTSLVRVREHSYASKTLIDTDVWLLVENISYCDLVCHLWQRSIIHWVAFFQGSRCVCVYVCVCGVVVVTVWCVVVVSHTQAVFHLVFHLLPPAPPVHSAVIGYLVANSRPFLMKQQWSRWDFGCLHHLLWGQACAPARVPSPALGTLLARLTVPA